MENPSNKKIPNSSENSKNPYSFWQWARHDNSSFVEVLLSGSALALAAVLWIYAANVADEGQKLVSMAIVAIMLLAAGVIGIFMVIGWYRWEKTKRG